MKDYSDFEILARNAEAMQAEERAEELERWKANRKAMMAEIEELEEKRQERNAKAAEVEGRREKEYADLGMRPPRVVWNEERQEYAEAGFSD